MGQTVNRGSGTELTYNTRIRWLIRRRHSKNHALPKGHPARQRSVPKAKPRQRSAAKAKLPKDHAGRVVNRRKDHAGKAVGGRETALQAGADRVAVRVAGKAVVAIAVTTGVVAIAAALKVHPKSISRS
jgi:hypothetical protein